MISLRLSRLCGSYRIQIFLRPFIHGGKDQHKSCTAHHGEPLLWPCFFFGYFSGLDNVASPCKQRARIMVQATDHPASNEHGSRQLQATSTDHVEPRKSALSSERRRRNHFTTAPPFTFRSKLHSHAEILSMESLELSCAVVREGLDMARKSLDKPIFGGERLDMGR